ncbi:unnamed protein product [Rotaria sp. Silwood2]|nr:unnamed protein product [Rotaria sp. Silwood2]CAF4264388.1 unnamed protein product [Rotaria sp. Silwood2]
MEDTDDWTCETWNEAGESTQTVHVIVKDKRGKAKHVRKSPTKTAPKTNEESSKKDQRKQALEQEKIQTAIPTIETLPATNVVEDDQCVPSIEKSGCKADGFRHSKPADKVKRVSQAKLDIIVECQLRKVEIAKDVKFKTEINTTTSITTLFISKCRQTDDSHNDITLQNEHRDCSRKISSLC